MRLPSFRLSFFDLPSQIDGTLGRTGDALSTVSALCSSGQLQPGPTGLSQGTPLCAAVVPHPAEFAHYLHRSERLAEFSSRFEFNNLALFISCFPWAANFADIALSRVR
jgi:hypothetical protein